MSTETRQGEDVPDTVRRWADPDEFGSVATFLADPSITFHTGDAVVMDGSYTIF